MIPTSRDTINRREALRRAALLLGGALSAPTVAAVLAACADRGGRGEGGGALQALTADQAELVATIAEHILPETDTPGARAVGVHQFIDALLADAYTAADRQRFLVGLADVDARARGAHGHAFRECAPAEQRAVLEQLDREAFAGPGDQQPVPFFRTMKELTLVGYYTSEIGATRELHHAPVPGRFEGCVPLTQIGRTWAV